MTINIAPTAAGFPTPKLSPTGSALGAAQSQPAAGVSAGSFQGALDGVSESLAEADLLSQQVATGEITDLSQLTAAAAKAELAVQLTVAFRDRAVDSFTQIMQMQV